MKNILIIILTLISISCYSQITFGELIITPDICIPIANKTQNSTNFLAGKLYISVLIVDSCNNYGTIQNSSMTWDIVSQQQTGSTGNTRRISIMRAAGITETVNIKMQVNSANGFYWQIYEVSGVPLGNNGADAIVQVKKDSAFASANPTITMSALRGGSNAVLTFFNSNTNPLSGSPESGWTELFDVGCTFGGVQDGFYGMKRIGTSDNTPSTTASASDWIGVALEFRTTRRATVIN